MNPPNPNFPPDMPDDLKEKIKQIKAKLEKFKTGVLKEFKKDIKGIALLPARRIDERFIAEEEQYLGRRMTKEEVDEIVKKEQSYINVLVLVDDSDKEIQPDYKLKDKVSKPIIKIANDIDKKFMLRILLLSELKETCYDGKYDLIQDIGLATIIHDPVELIVALKVAEIHKNMILQKFDKYIFSYILGGSLFRGEKANDIDGFVIIDDTDVKKMSRLELRDKLRRIIVDRSFDAAEMVGVKKQFHIQVYILTDFWEWVKEASPVIFTLLRDGVPILDKGVFMPWRLLLKMGRIKPSPEAIDMHMDMGDRMIKRAKGRLIGIVLDDLFWSVMNPSQAALMLYGISPTTPKETVSVLRDVFVKKEKILEDKYVDILESIRQTFKDVEHAKIKEVTGIQVDKMIKDCEIYLKRINKLFNQIEKKKNKDSFMQTYNSCVKITKDVLATSDMKGKLEVTFKKYCEKYGLTPRLVQTLKDLEKAKKDFLEKKLSKVEQDKVRREARTYVRLLAEHLQRKKHYEYEKATIRFKYGKKLGEMMILDNTAYLTLDISEKEREIKKAQISKTGSLGKIEKSSEEELKEKMKTTKVPYQLYIKEKLFEDLKKLLGEDVEILLNF